MRVSPASLLIQTREGNKLGSESQTERCPCLDTAPTSCSCLRIALTPSLCIRCQLGSEDTVEHHLRKACSSLLVPTVPSQGLSTSSSNEGVHQFVLKLFCMEGRRILTARQKPVRFTSTSVHLGLSKVHLITVHPSTVNLSTVHLSTVQLFTVCHRFFKNDR